MIAPAEAPESAPRPSWLDRWFEPPWRALLTWVVLAMLGSLANSPTRGHKVVEMVYLVLDLLARALHTLLPHEMWEIGILSNLCLLVFWIEPLALRLNLLRGLAWIGLRSVPFVGSLVFLPYEGKLMLPFVILACSPLSALVLKGWRSRPWMLLIGAALMAGVFLFLQSLQLHGNGWFQLPAMSLPFAAVLLYGTRRLPR